RVAAIWAFVFMVLEAAIGAGIVLLEMVADNQSMARAGWMAAHLLNTFLLLAFLALSAWWSSEDASGLDLRANRAVAWILGLALFGSIIVGMTGAVTALG